ncbi:hypothetical protein Hanom_Chr04g00298471 [Helianthus anomalus]
MKAQERRVVSVVCVEGCRPFCRSKKTNPLLLTYYRLLVHLFSCRCLQMWSADCRHFPAEKTNNTN